MRICPFCREKIHPEAAVCRHCRRDLPAVLRQGRSSVIWVAVAAATALIAAGAVVLAAGFLRERRNWLQ